MKSKLAWFTLGLLIGTLTASWRAVKTETSSSRNQVTILEDLIPLPGTALGETSIQLTNKGRLVGNAVPRWVIPGRVIPKLYGEPPGAAYFYFDTVTQLREGKFLFPLKADGTDLPPEVLQKTMERAALSCGQGSNAWAPRGDGKCYEADSPVH